eukprot:gene16696-22960_t
MSAPLVHSSQGAVGAKPIRSSKLSRKSLVVRADAKDICFGVEGRRRLQIGINKVADAVAHLICLAGRNVVLEQKYGVPLVINDGVSIARAVELPDPIENAGAQLIKEVAGRTNDSAGDGTTTASVLAREMVHYGLQFVTAGSNPIALKKGIDKSCAFLLEKLKENSIPVKGREDIMNIATISAGNDALVGEMIATALDKVGNNGVLAIETSSSTETVVEVQEGMAIDRGYISPQFVTAQDRLMCELENVRILVTDQKIEQIRDILPVLEHVTTANVPLLIIAEEVSGEALATLVVNKMRGVLQCAAIKAPGFGERRKALLQDIAIVTGAEFIAKDLGMKVEATTLEQLGVARKVSITSNNTILIADSHSREEIDVRIAQLKREMAESESGGYDQEKLQERIAKLSGGVAVIKVGAPTESELEDRKLRIEDAKNATFAAVEEGIVPGGGAALLHLSELLPAFKDTLTDPEEKLGCDIVLRAMRAPQRIIAENSGIMLTTQAVMVEKVKGDASFAGLTSEGMPTNMTV